MELYFYTICILGFIACIALKLYADKYAKEQNILAENWFKEVENAKPSKFKQSPIKLQKNEEFISSIPADLLLYKNDGSVGYQGLTARVKITKGIYYRAGSGKVNLGKSLQHDQNGEIFFTNKRVIFNGTNNNKSIPWSKIISFGITKNAKQLHIERENGADWIFNLYNFISPSEFKSIDLAYNK